MAKRQDAAQRTISKSGSISGIGLHSGCTVTLTLHAAQPDHGRKFRRTDLPGAPIVDVDIRNAHPATRHTLLRDGSTQILTPEHVLSALVGLGIDNVLIDVDGIEPPILDGSARQYVSLIEACGIAEQGTCRTALQVSTMVRLVLDGGTEYLVLPWPALRISCVYEDQIGPLLQHASVDIDATTYATDISLARTFVWWQDIKPLLEQGLIKGGTLESAVVLGMELADGSAKSIEWRCADEVVKHKMLDLIGDLALLGMPLQAHVIALKPGHTANALLVKKLQGLCQI